MENFVRSRTRDLPVPLCPELRIHVARDVTAVWEATESRTGRSELPPPFWAFCWPGGQALARWLLDNPSVVGDLRVLDFGAGCGVAAIAAVKAGAGHVIATDIDPIALTAMRLNASSNGVDFEMLMENVVGRSPSWDVVLAGDVCYEKRLADPLLDWLRMLAREGVRVLLSDPGRAYLPSSGLRQLASYRVPTSLDLEDAEHRITGVYEIEG